MNLILQFFYSLSSKKDLSRLNFDKSLFYFLIMIIALSISLGTRKLPDIIQNQFFNNAIIIFSFLIGSVLALGLISLFLTFFLKIYKDKIKFKDVTKAIIYSFTPIYITLFFSILIFKIQKLILAKPITILIIVIYTAYLLNKAIINETKIDKGFSISAIILAFVFGYIISLGIIDVILFYAIIMGLVFWKRKKFTPQNIVLLLKTQIGLKTMDKIANKFPKTLLFLSNIGIWTGFLFMIIISVGLIINVIQLLINPATVPAASPVLPGVPIPGAPITLPLWYGVISIFLVVLIHEFSHGVIARLHKIKVKSSGFLFMGPIIGAFVEPDEKTMSEKKRKKQLGVLAAGPFSNILLAAIAIGLIFFIFAPLNNSMIENNGAIVNVLPQTPAFESGLLTGSIIKKIDNTNINNQEDLYQFLNSTKINQTIEISTLNESIYLAVLTAHPEKNNTGYLGITATSNTIIKESTKEKLGSFIPNTSFIFQKFLFWLFVISLGIGIANLIPLGPVDGGRMILLILEKYFPKEKAKEIWTKLSTFFIILLIFVLFSPLFKWIMGQF